MVSCRFANIADTQIKIQFIVYLNTETIYGRNRFYNLIIYKKICVCEIRALSFWYFNSFCLIFFYSFAILLFGSKLSIKLETVFAYADSMLWLAQLWIVEHSIKKIDWQFVIDWKLIIDRKGVGLLLSLAVCLKSPKNAICVVYTDTFFLIL